MFSIRNYILGMGLIVLSSNVMLSMEEELGDDPSVQANVQANLHAGWLQANQTEIAFSDNEITSWGNYLRNMHQNRDPLYKYRLVCRLILEIAIKHIRFNEWKEVRSDMIMRMQDHLQDGAFLNLSNSLMDAHNSAFNQLNNQSKDLLKLSLTPNWFWLREGGQSYSSAYAIYSFMHEISGMDNRELMRIRPVDYFSTRLNIPSVSLITDITRVSLANIVSNIQNVLYSQRNNQNIETDLRVLEQGDYWRNIIIDDPIQLNKIVHLQQYIRDRFDNPRYVFGVNHIKINKMHGSNDLFHFLCDLEHLVTLKMNNINFNSNQIYNILKSLSRNNTVNSLNSLGISNMNINLEAGRKLVCFNRLTELNLLGCDLVEPNDWIEILKFIPEDIKILVLSRNKLNIHGLKAIKKLSNLKSIVLNKLSGINGSDWIEVLNNLPPDIRNLSLMGNNMNDDAISIIARFSQLRMLNLNDIQGILSADSCISLFQNLNDTIQVLEIDIPHVKTNIEMNFLRFKNLTCLRIPNWGRLSGVSLTVYRTSLEMRLLERLEHSPAERDRMIEILNTLNHGDDMHEQELSEMVGSIDLEDSFQPNISAEVPDENDEEALIQGSIEIEEQVNVRRNSAEQEELELSPDHFWDISGNHSHDEWSRIIDEIPLEVRYVSFHYSNYGGENVERFTQLSALSHLDFAHNRFSGGVWDRLLDALPNSIEVLDFRSTNYNGSFNSKFSKFDNLKKMYLPRMKQSHVKFEALMENLSASLEELVIDGYYCGCNSEKVSSQQNLKKLELKECVFHYPGWISLLNNLPSSLESIDFIRCNYQGELCEKLLQLPSLTNIVFTEDMVDRNNIRDKLLAGGFRERRSPDRMMPYNSYISVTFCR